MFIFEREKSDAEATESLEGSLSALIEKGLFKVQGNASLNMKDFESKKFEVSSAPGLWCFSYTDCDFVQKVTCTYYGDFLLENVPTTFAEGIFAAKTIPKLVQKCRKPMKATLLPLCKLDNRAAKLMRQISDQVITELGNYIQWLNDIISASEVMASGPLASKMVEFSPLLKRFASAITAHRSRYAALLSKKLPQIRSTGESEGELLNEMRFMRDASPFEPVKVETWLRRRRQELTLFEAHLNRLEKSGARLLLNEKLFTTEIVNADDSPFPTLVVRFASTFVSNFVSFLEKYNKDLQLGKTRSDQDNGAIPEDVAGWVGSDAQRVFRRIRAFCSANDVVQSSEDVEVKREPVQVLLSEFPMHEWDTDSPSSTMKLNIELHKEGIEPVSIQVPTPPQDLDVVDIKLDSFKVQWSAPSQAANLVRRYRVLVTPVENKRDAISKTTTSNVTSMVVEGLSKSTVYNVQVLAVTKAGLSPASSTEAITSGAPFGSPKALKVEDVSPNSLKLCWNAPSSGTVHGYEACLHSTSDPSYKVTKVIEACSKLAHTFTNLTPSTEFEMCVFAVASSGFKSMAKIKGNTKASQPMSSPRNLRVSGLSSWQFKLEWDAPLHGSDDVYYYKVDVYEVLDINENQKKFKTLWPRKKCVMQVQGLEPGHAYKVVVTAVTQKGETTYQSTMVLSKRRYINNVLVVHNDAYTHEKDIVGAIKDGKWVGGEGDSHDINKGFGVKRAYLRKLWSLDPHGSADNITLYRGKTSPAWTRDRRQWDYAAGAGGEVRHLDVWKQCVSKAAKRITDVALWEGKLTSVPSGWQGYTPDLNSGGRFLHLVWKTFDTSNDPAKAFIAKYPKMFR